MTAAPLQETLDPAVAALHRAMPYTRLVDCGMNPADARALLAGTAAGGAWAGVAGELAATRAAAAEDAAAADHRITAAQYARWAAAAALFAQMAENEDTPLKRELYRRYVQRVDWAAQLHEPVLERLELPYRESRLVGWLCLPPADTAAATVVAWGGLSGWGAAYLGAAISEPVRQNVTSTCPAGRRSPSAAVIAPRTACSSTICWSGPTSRSSPGSQCCATSARSASSVKCAPRP